MEPFCPLEMYSAWMSRDETGAKGLISPLEDVFHLEAVRDCRAVGPHLSFGNSIQSVSLGAARGHGACFLLRKEDSACQSGGREGPGASFVLRKRILPGSREMKQGAMGLICPLETGLLQDVAR